MQPNEIVSFDNPEFGNVRTIDEDGKALFCAKDIAAALGYANTKDAVKRHCRGVAKRYPLRKRKFFGWNMEKFAHLKLSFCMLTYTNGSKEVTK